MPCKTTSQLFISTRHNTADTINRAHLWPAGPAVLSSGPLSVWGFVLQAYTMLGLSLLLCCKHTMLVLSLLPYSDTLCSSWLHTFGTNQPGACSRQRGTHSGNVTRCIQ